MLWFHSTFFPFMKTSSFFFTWNLFEIFLKFTGKSNTEENISKHFKPSSMTFFSLLWYFYFFSLLCILFIFLDSCNYFLSWSKFCSNFVTDIFLPMVFIFSCLGNITAIYINTSKSRKTRIVLLLRRYC